VIPFTCRKCGGLYDVSDSLAGTVIDCPSCHTSGVVPPYGKLVVVSSDPPALVSARCLLWLLCALGAAGVVLAFGEWVRAAAAAVVGFIFCSAVDACLRAFGESTRPHARGR
jgi:hypothetical protein